MAEHTPGPWTVNTEHVYNGARIDAPNGRSIGHSIQRDEHPQIGQGISQAVAMANGQLIAAAPELLNLAQAVMESCNNGYIANTSHADTVGVLADAARMVIAKATGRAHD